MEIIKMSIFASFCCVFQLLVDAAPAPSSLQDKLAKLEDKSSFHRYQPDSPYESSDPSKDAFALLNGLTKVRGPDGRPPVCKICQMHFVDPHTYDYFCMPGSNGVNGHACDRLTILGTTAARNVALGCKVLMLRTPSICK